VRIRNHTAKSCDTKGCLTGRGRSTRRVPSRATPGGGDCAADGRCTKRRAGAIGAAQGGSRRAFKVMKRARHRQAAFFALVDRSRGRHHGRVDHVPHVPHAVGVGAVVDKDRELDPDLRGSQANAVGYIHRGEHVVDQLAERVIEGLDRSADGFEHRVAHHPDLARNTGHRATLPGVRSAVKVAP
jgi:hypothetical protein